MKAVIPAAGRGTRFLPMTKNSPKEMLPLIDRPAIQYVVEEAVQSGCDDIIIVTGRGKHAIEDHFDHTPELEDALERSGDEALREVRYIANMADIHYIRQKEPLGLGHAILCAKRHIGNEAFAVLLGDDVVFSGVPCMQQLIQQHNQTGNSIVAVERITSARVPFYGVVNVGMMEHPKLYRVLDLVEKPEPQNAPSNLGILGRYVFTPSIFDALEQTKPGKKGEIQLTDAMRLLREPLYAYEFEGKRFDLGNKMDWLKTNVEVALLRKEYHDEFRRFLVDLLHDGGDET